MKTIKIPTSKLIKFIPSDPDGELIPGRVIRCGMPYLTRLNDYTFVLDYVAYATKAHRRAQCKLDEDLEVVSGSNSLEVSRLPRFDPSRLIDDGVHFRFESHRTTPIWRDGECRLPNPFDAIGPHKLSDFVPCGKVQIATLLAAQAVRLAIVATDSNQISEPIVPNIPFILPCGALLPDAISEPCRHAEGWLIPWSSITEGVNIEWITDREMSGLIERSGIVNPPVIPAPPAS